MSDEIDLSPEGLEKLRDDALNEDLDLWGGNRLVLALIDALEEAKAALEKAKEALHNIHVNDSNPIAPINNGVTVWDGVRDYAGRILAELEGKPAP